MHIQKTNERGVAHLALILIVVVVAGVAGAGYLVFKKNQDNGSGGIASVLKNAKCDLDDKDLCKFLANWKANKYYTVNSTSSYGGQASTSTYQAEGTDKFHIKTTGSTSYETITIGDVVYTKDASDNKWWKQTLPKEDTDKYKGTNDYDFKEPKKEDTSESKTAYKRIGTEKCGDLTCFKYQVINPGSSDTTEYIWFDNKNYQLRRTQTVSKDGTSDATFSYAKFSLTAPSPVKELGANQVVIPGQSEPMTLPSEQDVQGALDQAQNYSTDE